MRDATYVCIPTIGKHLFQSTHPMRDATIQRLIFTVCRLISIHASHAGCDRSRKYCRYVLGLISIRASHAGCDAVGCMDCIPLLLFQSTHPMRDATCAYRGILPCTIDFNPRIPCGMRLVVVTSQQVVAISIHASHAGCDILIADLHSLYGISIHASHAGCD